MDIRWTIVGEAILALGIVIAAVVGRPLGVAVMIAGGVIASASYFRDR